jgi:hypothetical protein
MSDSNDPKYKNRLKERPNRPGQKDVGLTQIFGANDEARGAMVPAQRPAPTGKKGERWQEADTISTPPTKRTSVGGTGEAALTSTSTRSQGGSRSRKKERNPMALFLIVLVVAGGLFLLLGNQKKGSSAGVSGGTQGSASSASIHTGNERVDFHRTQTGRQLNRERMNVEYDNAMTAPTDIKFEKKTNPNEMLSGLPLSGETHHRGSTRDRTVPLNPDFADARIQYSLMEEKATREWEEKERKRISEEFIAKAARHGYKVVVDKDGVAHVTGRLNNGERQPNSDQKGDPGQPGGAR